MTEAEWLRCCEPLTAYEAMRQLVSDRKLRLCGRESSASVHSFAFTASAPFFAAVRIARLLPVVVARPPTPNAFRHFHTTPDDTPNQYRSAAALSVRIAFASSSLTHNPDPPRCSHGCTRGHGIGASLNVVTVQSRSRYKHVTRSPRLTAGARYSPMRGGAVGTGESSAVSLAVGVFNGRRHLPDGGVELPL